MLHLNVLVFLFGLLQVATCTKILPLPNDWKLDSIHSESTRCADTLSGPSGSISYKPGEVLGANERCGWVIRDNATEYSIAVLSLGHTTPSENYQITVTGIQVTSSSFARRPTTLNATGLYIIEKSNFLVVTLHTGGNVPANGTGFQLQYIARNHGDLDYYPSNSSADLVFPLANENLRSFYYPDSGNYSANELNIFLFFPQGHVYSAQRRTDVTVILDSRSPRYTGDRWHNYIYLPVTGWTTGLGYTLANNGYFRSSTDIQLLIMRSGSASPTGQFQVIYGYGPN